MWKPVTFYYQSSLDELEATSQASGYDPTNLLGGFETDCWKATGPTSQVIASDAGTGHLLTVDYFTMGAHNLRTAEAMVSFQYANWPFFSDWTQVSCGGQQKYAHAAAVVNSEMYVFGGFSYTFTPTAEFIKYNPFTNEWTILTSGAPGRAHASLVAIGADLYLYGGVSSLFLNDCWKYNTITGSWTQVASGIGQRYQHAAAAYNGEMYVFGGKSTSMGSFMSAMVKYNPSSNTWTAVSCASIGRAGHTMVPIGENLFIFGGQTQTNSTNRDCWRYNTTQNSWTACSTNVDALASTCYHASAAVNSEMFVFGGAPAQKYMWRYSPSSDTWTMVASAAVGRDHHTLVAIGNLMYMYAGVITTTTSPGNDLWSTTGMRIAIPASGEVSYTGSEFMPDEDAVTLKTWDTAISARAWRIQINTPAAVPYIGFARWGQKTELDYLDVKVDPGKRKRHANVNVSQTGYLQGVWEYYTEREIDCSFTAAQSSLYQRVSDWYDIHGMKNFVMQWEPTSHSTETWIVRADPELGAPMYAGGNYRDIRFTLRGRKT